MKHANSNGGVFGRLRKGYTFFTFWANGLFSKVNTFFFQVNVVVRPFKVSLRPIILLGNETHFLDQNDVEFISRTLHGLSRRITIC